MVKVMHVNVNQAPETYANNLSGGCTEWVLNE